MTTTHVGILRADGQARVHVGNNYFGSSDFLPAVHEAAFDSLAEQHNARCHRDTRTELLCQIRKWADDPHSESIFWLNGMAGTGKSTVSRTVATAFAGDGLLGASFFFKRGEGDRGKATLFFPTIARQLVCKIPTLAPFVREAIDADPDIARKGLKDQFKKLILQPLGRVHRSMAIMIVIDALDECDGDNDVKAIIPLLAQAKTLRSARLRIFITSRPELPIRLGFKNVQGKYQDLALHQIPEPIVEHDISAFLEHELARIRDEFNSQALEGLELPPDWPGKHAIRSLAQMAVPLFIFAATVCRFVEDPGWSDPADQLEKVLQYQTKTHDSELDKLDATYLPVLNQLIIGRTDPQRRRLLAEFRDVVGPIILLAQPLSVSSLARLLGMSPKAIHGRLSSLHSVLSIPSGKDTPVRLFHLSFRDFLVDPAKRANEFWIDETKYHRTLADRCIQLMYQHLRRDICGLQVPGKLRSEVDQQTIDAALPPEAQYACQYWVHHLKESKGSIRDGGPAHGFLTNHLLHWLEALGLLDRVSESIGMVDDLLALLDPAEAIEVSVFLRDIKRVVLSSSSIIGMAPLQVYVSVLVFSPARSMTRKLFKHEEPKWIITGPAVEDDWSACRQTLEGHRGIVTSVAFSPDSKFVVSASYDQTVKIWDAATRTYMQTLRGHSGIVISAAFSPDSKFVVSGSHDNTVKIWDAATGKYVQTFEGHSDPIFSAAFLPDSKLVASASYDQTVKIWDTATGTCTQTFERYIDVIYSVAFSPDSKLIALKLKDNTIKMWDTATGTCMQTLKGHGGAVYSISFSSDSNLVASGSNDNTVKIWDATTGICMQTLEGHGGAIFSVAFSPDSKLVASKSGDNTVKIWNAATGTCTQTRNVGRALSNISFNPTGSHLYTGTGTSTIDLTTPPSSTLRAASSRSATQDLCRREYGISSDGRWIMRGSENWLWLPPKYQPDCSAVAASAIVFGCSSGRVLIMTFSTDN
ncbi:hypothetical protein DL768_001491 [Monosporascus sp. mg162]|nr:hypothetical protein DL768_001491 [Monosporascus sp. mg162]